MTKLCCGSITLCSDKGAKLATVFVYHGQEKEALNVVNRLGKLMAQHHSEAYHEITLQEMMNHVDEKIEAIGNGKMLKFGSKKPVDVEGQLMLF